MKLPLKCKVDYLSDFVPREEANCLYNHLSEKFDGQNFIVGSAPGIDLKVDFGKMMFIYSNLIQEGKFPQEIWGKTAHWTEEMSNLKAKVKRSTGHEFQVCVCIFYPDGNSGVDFHSDYVAFGDTNLIPSISLGAERNFILREKENGSEHPICLKNGSMLVMGNNCQQIYEHSLPVDVKCKTGRINLTFRKYGF